MVAPRRRRPSPKQTRAARALTDGVGIKAQRPMCVKSGKVRFATVAAAGRGLTDARAIRTGDHVEQRAYECRFCDGWHLTSKRLR